MTRRDDHRRRLRLRSRRAARARLHFRGEDPAPVSFEAEQRWQEAQDLALAMEWLQRRDVTNGEPGGGLENE